MVSIDIDGSTASVGAASGSAIAVVRGGLTRDAQPSHAVLHALSCTGLVVSMSIHASPLLSLLWDGHSHRRHKLIDNLS